jgi:predicted membrane-bound dolichyl-phosphate-mannose-protein mannosyltransferase
VKKKLAILLALLCVMAIALPVLGESANLVRNGDFEKYDDLDYFPESWSFHSYETEYNDNHGNATAVCEVDDQRASSVLHISVLADDDAAVFQTVAVEPLTVYRLSCWIKTQGVENGIGANIALREIIATSSGLYGDNDWTLVTLTGKTGPDQTRLVVSCRIGGYSAVAHGDAWFDDFTVEKVEDAEGDIMPFYDGEVEEDENGSRSGVLLTVLLLLAAVVICGLAIFFILKKRGGGDDKGGKKPLPSPASYSNDSSRKLTGMEAVNGRSFFDMRGDTMPAPTDTKLHFTKRDRIYLIALTVVYGIIALVRLGTLNFPTSYWSGNVGDTVRIEFGRSVKLSDVWQNTGISHTDYKLVTDNGEEIAFASSSRSEYGHMFRWTSINKTETANSTETTGVTLVVLGGDSSRPKEADLVLLELAFFDENGELIECTASAGAEAIVDEQKTVPAYTSYMTGMYFDELYHGRTALEHINNSKVYEWTHPPLGKLIISVGILIFGMKPFGWRIMGVLFGIAMVPVMYCFGKKLLKRSELALFSTFLFTFDFMHFTQTRIATIDGYGVFFILLMTYFMYDFISMDIGDDVSKMMKSLALSGVFFGLGVASKWIDLYTGVALAILYFVKLVLMGVKSYRLSKVKKYEKDGLVRKYWNRAITLCCWCVIFFIVVPAVIYCASYCRYYSAQWKPDRQTALYKADPTAYDSPEEVKLTFTDSVDTYIKGVIKNQKDMYNYHSQLKSDHSAASSWWMWLGDLRPTWFYVGGRDKTSGSVGTISTFGNPAVWVPCTIASIALIFVLIFRRKKFPLEAWFLYICAASSFLPWVLVPRSTYAYHFFATVPFITLLTGYLVGYIEDVNAEKKAKKKQSLGVIPKLKYVWMVIVFVLFIVFYPVISGMEVPYEYIYALQWVPFHKWEIRDSADKVIKTYRIGWRFLDYEPSNPPTTIIYK